MALDATAGGANSNSYLSVADADSYVAERVGDTSAWDVDDAEKEKALISATRRLDQQDFKGCKTTREQALEWPRYDVPDRSGWYYDSDAIPAPIKQAAAELALVLIGNPELLDDTGLEYFDAISTGDTSITPKARQAGTLPAHVQRFLRGLTKGGAGVTRLVRG
ncbi:MAG TPA: DnaT-like ssDNA-binding protein [Blastocatellia bacterium]